ncbi:MAG: TorF family putative porin [Pseudomonadota bacterium]|nr:TorF family putative porin [Pseudomonadota bacterium]
MNVLKKSLLASAVTLASATAVAELSMTVGMVSDYVYRGVELGDAGAYTSIDYAAGGFYAGVWAISDGGTADGIEYDIYAGYETEIAGVGVGIGYTAYEYTYGDAAEDEISLSLSKGPISLTYVDGELVDDTEYEWLIVGADVGAFSFTYGEEDESGFDYMEVSTGTEVGAVSLGVTLGGNSDGNDYLTLDMSTGIDL